MKGWRIRLGGTVIVLVGLFITAATAAIVYFPNTTLAIDMLATGCASGSSGMHYALVTDGTNLFCDPPQSFAVGSANTRTLSLSTAYQATDTSKASHIMINLVSSATLNLSGGTTNVGNLVVGATTGVTGGTGAILCIHKNQNTGTLTIGLALTQVIETSCSVDLPAGWYFAIRQISGTVTIDSAFDQSLG